MKPQRTTAEHFQLFQAEFRRWVEIFGLKQWELYFQHKLDKENRATIYWNIPDYIATITLSTVWYDFEQPITEEEIRQCAFHETCEMLLAPLNACAQRRFLDEHEIQGESHVLIRKLENVLFPKYRE